MLYAARIRERPSPRKGVTLLELLVCLCIITLLVGLLVPAVQRIRDSAARARCAGQLREIGLALHHYHDMRGQLPSGSQPWEGYKGSKDWCYSMPWHVRLLPFVEQGSLFEQAARAYAADSMDMRTPPHMGHVVLPIYLCPSESRRLGNGANWQWATTSYLGVSGPVSASRQGTLFCLSAIRLTAITDGTSQTIMVGERPPGAGLRLGKWYYGGSGALLTEAGEWNTYLGVRETVPPTMVCPKPAAFRPGEVDNPCDDYHFWSLHAGGANFAFADGSVRFLPYSADRVIKALSTRAGGEIVTEDD